jgi:hypothetical protein
VSDERIPGPSSILILCLRAENVYVQIHPSA